MVGAVPGHRPNHPRIDTGEPVPLGDVGGRQLEEIANLANQQAAETLAGGHDDDCPFVARSPCTAQQFVRIDDGQEGPPHVHEAGDRGGHVGYAGGRQRREDFPHNPCRGCSDQVADAENDGVEGRGVSHLY